MPGEIKERPGGRRFASIRQAEARRPKGSHRAPGKKKRQALTDTAYGGQRALGRTMRRRCMMRPQEGQYSTELDDGSSSG